MVSILLNSQTLPSVPMAFEDWRTAMSTEDMYFRNIVKTDSYRNVITAGASMSNGFPDIQITKTDAFGHLLWSKHIANSNPTGVDFIAGLFVTDTTLYVTGSISSNTVTGATDCYTAKLNSTTGNVVWSSTYTSAGGLAAGNFIVLKTGSVYVSGGTYNTSLNADYLMLKYNEATGAQTWVTTYGYGYGSDDGSVALNFSGTSAIVTGFVTSAPNNYKISTLTLSGTTGSITAVNTSTAVTTSSVDAVTDLIVDNAGDVIIAGSQYISGQNNFYVQKLSGATLSTVFTYAWSSAGSYDDFAKAIGIDASNNIFVSGFSTNSITARDLTLIKLNSSGINQFTKTSGLPGNDESADLIIDANGDAYCTGYKTTANPDKNFYTVKYSGSTGTKLWEAETDGHYINTDDYATNITLDSLNNVIITGQGETSTPGTFECLTIKYEQKNVITPTDFNGETPDPNFMYYENRGQLIGTNDTLVPDIKFYTNNTYPAFYFKDQSQSFVFARIDTVVSTTDTLNRIDLTFTNSNTGVKTYPMNKQEDGYLNYFLAHTNTNGVVGVHGSQRLITSNLYNNIDLMCSSNQNGIKYYFIVKPGGDPKNIQMEFTGASSFSIDATTKALSVNGSIGSLTYDRPVVYQLTATNATLAVTSFTPDWRTNGASNKYQFNIAAYTHSLILVIEVDQGNDLIPSHAAINNLTWCTYYGGNAGDVFYDVNTNSSNDIWVTGRSESTNFPVSTGDYQATNLGDYDAIFVKFTDTGIRKWATYIGGGDQEGDDNNHGIEVDNSGNCYSSFVTHSADFPVKNSHITGAYYDSIPSSLIDFSTPDIAIVSFNINGQLTWSTFFGEVASLSTTYDLGLDRNNNLFVTGTGAGIPLLHPSGSYTTPYSFTSGAFIVKFDSNHNHKWSSYIGGDEQYAQKIAFSSSNDIILVGEVNSDTPPGGGIASSTVFDLKNPGGGAYFKNTFNGGAYDGIIMRFSGTTNDLLWSTFFGGNSDERLRGITMDDLDNIYISGESQSSSGMVTRNLAGLNDTVYSGQGTYFSGPLGDGILAKFNSSNQQVSSTYIGGAANDGSYGINYKNAKLFTHFVTAGNDMPFYGSNPPNVFVQANNATGQDVSNDSYFAVMDRNFNFNWTSYFGGTSSGPAPYKEDFAYSSVPTNSNKFYMVGYTLSDSTTFPKANPGGGAYYKGTKSSTIEAFIAQFSLNGLPLAVQESVNQENETLTIYPNPTNNYVFINYPDNINYSIEVLDITGRRVYYKEICTGMDFKVDVSAFARGAYIVKATNKEKFAVKKLIID